MDPMSSFEVKNIIPIHFFSLDFSITNSSLYMLVTVAMILILFGIGTRNSKMIPNKIQFLIEKMFFFIGDIVKTSAGDHGIQLFPYIFSLFLFICIGNITGLLPFAFSFTSQLVVTMGMAGIVFVASIIVGISRNGLHYFRQFCPKGLPAYLVPFFVVIELISFIFRPFSLGIRLFANIVAGHVMIKVIAGFAVSVMGVVAASWLAIPIVAFDIAIVAFDVALNVFKLAICVLQAYVFVILSCTYLAESMAHEED
ncbi:MAG: F0F1 ATP synthase subunit A [Holosporales bacterium]|jgi:F-type H+-transporting ATPase subunit a|nr:F0F1 ATP synthase subunit A [Holosporales bacterium]